MKYRVEELRGIARKCVVNIMGLSLYDSRLFQHSCCTVSTYRYNTSSGKCAIITLVCKIPSSTNDRHEKNREQNCIKCKVKIE